MATNKNITMKQFNGRDYDTLYPKTIASQIPDVYSKSYIDSILKNNARIQAGSYVGTGTYGSDNPCSLTFDFIPRIVWIYGIIDRNTNIYYAQNIGYVTGYASNAILPISIFSNTYTLNGFRYNKSSSDYQYVYTRFSNNTLQWYVELGPSINYADKSSAQNNSADREYYYIALG